MAIKISIVTPVYNGARFMSQTIESILSQAGNFYIDYIIIDDGSTDNSLEIIKKYDSLVHTGGWKTRCLGIEMRYLTGPNKGQSRAYNTGFGMANGDLCAWMNADDYYMPGIFEHVSKLYENDPSLDFIYGDCLKIYEDGSKQPSIEPRPRPNETFESLRTRGNSFDLCFFTKRIFDKVGPLDESLKYCMDLDFWFKVMAVGKVTYIPKTIAAFRLWSGSNTVTKQDGFTKERKLIARRYGCTIIPSKDIYSLRGKMTFLNTVKNKAPKLYERLKKVFYNFTDIFRYKMDSKKINKKTTN
jgi:glycosyltransferase involved in cell wall biosynthesis